MRNNKVFSRDEISKFGSSEGKYGGYTNKSAGEFQGKFEVKTKVYNPFLDAGGYNCRHSYDWISDDLAAIFRPELIKEGFDEKIKVKGGTIEVHKDHGGAENRKNIIASKKIIEKYGGNIKLLPTNNLFGLESVDAIYNGNLLEIKTINGSYTSINKRIHEMVGQFDNVTAENISGILVITENKNKDEVLGWVKNRIQARIIKKGRALDKMYVFGNGFQKTFNADDFK